MINKKYVILLIFTILICIGFSQDSKIIITNIKEYDDISLIEKNVTYKFNVYCERKYKSVTERKIIEFVENYYPYKHDWWEGTIPDTDIKAPKVLYIESLRYYINVMSERYLIYDTMRNEVIYRAEVRKVPEHEYKEKKHYNIYAVDMILTIEYGSNWNPCSMYKTRTVYLTENKEIIEIKGDNEPPTGSFS